MAKENIIQKKTQASRLFDETAKETADSVAQTKYSVYEMDKNVALSIFGEQINDAVRKLK